MKVGIIVFSYTKNTLKVAKMIKKRLPFNSNIEEIKISGNYKKDEYKILKKPNLKNYDLIILGSPVKAFSLSPVMTNYLKSKTIKNKKIVLYITQFFPIPQLGGNRALKTFEKNLERNEIIYKDVINWSSKKRDEQIERLIVNINKKARVNEDANS